MKAKNLLKVAKAELKDENDKKIVNIIKQQMREIEACKKTLRKLEKEHKKTLDANVEDLEADGYEY